MTAVPLHPDRRLLIGSFCAIAVSFVAAYGYSQHALAAVDRASDLLAEKSAPSIRHLAEMRTAVRQTQLWLEREVVGHDPAARAELTLALDRVHEEAHAYLVLPTFPGE